MARAPARSEPARGAPETSPAKPRSKMRIAMLTLTATMLLGGAAGGAWYFIAGGPTANAAVEKPPVFLSLEPLTVNLQGERAQEYLQVGLSVKLTSNSTADAIKLHMPEIRSRLLLLLSSKRASELLTVQGKQKLALEVAEEVKKPLKDEAQAQAVQSVVFTSFVIQ